jgi:hypothetical protein
MCSVAAVSLQASRGRLGQVASRSAAEDTQDLTE